MVEKKPLIILDRDGVINVDSDAYVKSPDEWIPLPGSLEAIARLKKSGYFVAVATNQSGIARGYYTKETLDAIHAKFFRLLKEYNATIDTLLFCPHVDEDLCLCRKPKPGMITQLLKQFSATPQNTFMVGDSARDLLAGQAAGCRPALVLTGKGNTVDQTEFSSLVVAENLNTFVTDLLSKKILP
jgi:D-glycero-D-manno-heptose 1,7-bisphosphate phosphatase